MWILQAESCSSLLSPLPLQALRQGHFVVFSGKPAPFTPSGFGGQNLTGETGQTRAENAGLRHAAKAVLPRGLCEGLFFARGYILDFPSRGCSLQHTSLFGNQTPCDGLDCWWVTRLGCHPRLCAVWIDGLPRPRCGASDSTAERRHLYALSPSLLLKNEYNVTTKKWSRKLKSFPR